MKKHYFPLSILLFVSISLGSPETYEQPPLLKAAETVSKDILKGTNYTIAETVKNDGYTNTYTINSKYGVFVAHGNSMLLVRLQEIEALAKLKEVSSSEAFAQAAAKQVMKPVDAATKIVQDPVETAKEIPGGIKRRFENVGRFIKKQTKEKPEGSEEKESATGGVAKSVLGVNAAHRKWAQQVGVDPYSTNSVLQSELDRLAKVDAIASLGVKMARPNLPGTRAITRAYNLAWGMDPQELQKLNEKRLTEIGIDTKLSQAFFQNKALTLTQQTMIVAAIHELPKTEGRAEFIRSATTAESEQDAYLYTDSADMILKMKTAGNEITRFIPNQRIIVLYSGNRFVAVLPVDRIYRTKDFAAALDQFQKRHATDLKKSADKEVWISGEASVRFQSELSKRGWKLSEKLSNQ